MTTKITRENIVTTALTTFDGPAITSVSYVGTKPAAESTGGETLTINGRAFSSGANVFIDNTIRSTTFVDSSTLTFISPSKAIGSYFLYVYNPDGSFAIKPNGITYFSSALSTIEYLLAAGGGGGASNTGGGGGAGGLRTSTASITTGTPYTITIGGGGTAGQATPGSGQNGVRGTDSSLIGGAVSISTTGGGGGVGADVGVGTVPAQNGGSGGGGSLGHPLGGTGNLGGYDPVEGFAGGTGTTSGGNFGGGGGGATAAGRNAGDVPGVAGGGGAGLYTSISGSNVAYAGGGGGGTRQGSGTQGPGGAGGGGAGNFANNAGVEGTPNTGGGGGGGGWASSYGGLGGIGGSGIAIIRYPNTYANATVTGSPNVIYANANIIYRFWQSGTITFT